jgi:hypothetical protein
MSPTSRCSRAQGAKLFSAFVKLQGHGAQGRVREISDARSSRNATAPQRRGHRGTSRNRAPSLVARRAPGLAKKHGRIRVFAPRALRLRSSRVLQSRLQKLGNVENAIWHMAFCIGRRCMGERGCSQPGHLVLALSASVMRLAASPLRLPWSQVCSLRLPKLNFMRVPSKVLNAVVFLGYRTEIDGEIVDEWGGTGLLVGVDDRDTLSPYIVTADHVAKELEVVAEPIARINDANGKGHHYRLMKPTRVEHQGRVTESTAWYRHPTARSKADVAVYPFSPGWIEDWDEAPFAYFPFEMFVAHAMLYGAEASIGRGDEIFVPGLVAHIAGDEANSPLLRVGNIAMLPDEQPGR